MRSDESRRHGSLLLTVVLSVGLMHLSVFFLFFLVPLQMLYLKRGWSDLVVASVSTVIGIVAVQFAIGFWTHHPLVVFETLGIGMAVILIGGLIAIDVLETTGLRFLYRLLIVSGVLGTISFVFLAWLLHQESFLKFVQNSFDELWGMALKSELWSNLSQSMGIEAAKFQASKDVFKEGVKELFLNHFFQMIVLMWMFTWKMGQMLDATKARPSSDLRSFFIPAQGVWFLLGAWGLQLAKSLAFRFGLNWDWGFFEYVVFNVSGIVQILYTLAGWGIVQTLLDRTKWPQMAQSSVKLVLILLLFSPSGMGTIAIYGLPLLAVLELWVNFRKQERRG